MFFIDMIVMFLTSYQDKAGHEVRDSIRIAERYMRSSRFVIDLLSLLGTGIVTQFYPTLKVFQCFKMNRVLRLGGIIQRLNIDEELKAVLNLLKLIFYLCLWLHINACVWFIAIEIRKDDFFENGMPAKWYPPLDWVNFADSILLLDETSLLYKYLLSYYIAILNMGCNELGPVNPGEMLVVSLQLVASSILNANLFGEIAMLIELLERSKTERQERLDTANTIMANIGLPDSVQDDIREFFTKSLVTREQQEELDKFLDQLSPSFKVQVQNRVFVESLKTNELVVQMTG